MDGWWIDHGWMEGRKEEVANGIDACFMHLLQLYWLAGRTLRRE
jgi:hypothetical protein